MHDFVIITLIISSIYFFYHKLTYWKRRGVVYMPPSFPFGNFTKMFFQQASLAELCIKFCKTISKPFFGVYLGFDPVLVINDPELVQVILVKDFNYFTDRTLHIDEKRDPLSSNLLGMRGEEWKNWRMKLSPAFTSRKLKDMFQIMIDCGNSLEAHITKLAERRGVIYVKEICAQFATNSIATTGFGIDIDCLADPNIPFRKYGRKFFGPGTKNSFRIMARSIFPNLLRLSQLKAIEQDIENFFIDAVRQTLEYRENGNFRNDFFQMLVELRNTSDISKDKEQRKTKITANENEKTLTLNQVASQAFLFYIAGFETVSTTMAYCLHELAKNQQIQSRVHKEIDEVMQKYQGEITYESLSEMKFLESCIDETLRLYPIASVMVRKCTKSYNIPNYNVQIAKGTLVLIPVISMHHNSKYFPDAETFQPDRFYRDNIGAKPFVEVPLLSFGDGPRKCIAMRLGKLSSKIGLLKMLHKCVYRLDGSHSKINFLASRFLLSPKIEMTLRIEPRE